MRRVPFSTLVWGLVIGGCLLGMLALTACEQTITTGEPAVPTLDAQLRRSIGGWGVVPIGAMPALNPAQVQLGQALFFDKILSGNRDISCAVCHQTQASLGDGLSLAVGTGGVGTGAARAPGPGRQFVPRNAPSLLNSGLGLYQLFWDARLTRFGPGTFSFDSGPVLPGGLSDILSAQAMLPVLNRREMRGEPGDKDIAGLPNELAQFGDKQSVEVWQGIMQRLMAVSEYMGLFNAAFPATVGQHRFEEAARALAAFEMEAFTHTRSPFDRYLDRDDNALTSEQKRGALLFFGKARCSQCHNGPFLGTQSVANVGVPQIGPGGARPPLDRGRGETQNIDQYQFAFRVAPLRNVELTAPYMHSGAFATLEAVVHHYNNVPKSLREYDPSQLSPTVRPAYHGDQTSINAVLATLDFRLLSPLGLTDVEMSELVAFLKSLTDPAARDLRALVPARVPSGLPVQQ